jgi:hypothetical protein
MLAQQIQLRQETKRRKQEAALAARSGNGGAGKGGRNSLLDSYTLKAVIAGHYALIGSRRLEIGDVIAGKKIVAIESDRITLDQGGATSTLQVGESISNGLSDDFP